MKKAYIIMILMALLTLVALKSISVINTKKLIRQQPVGRVPSPGESTPGGASAVVPQAQLIRDAAGPAKSGTGYAGSASSNLFAGVSVSLKIELPKPQFTGTPKNIETPNLEPPRNDQPRPPIIVPVGTKVISLDCKVTSSDMEPIIGELDFITDGDKEHDAATYVEIGPGTQWVQVDLGAEREINAACIWHYHGEARVYRDVVVQISNDPDFIDEAVTVFNNDHDDSSRLGKGKDKEYIETNEGRPFAVRGVRGRYVRFYSCGNTSNEMNHYTEVEIYGR